MKFRYSCFISYCHGRKDLTKAFIDQLKNSLEDYLELYLDEEVYIDEARLLPGYHYDEALAKAICQSICMIVVYTPRYERHSYCLREYAAMERIERSRRELLGNRANTEVGMIIPVIFRGAKEDLPDRLQKDIHYCDFSKFTTASPNINKNPEYVEQIEKIARVIHEHHMMFENLNEESTDLCNSFALPSEEDVEPWRRSSNGAAPFPGREVEG
jgi:hypothetical protein